MTSKMGHVYRPEIDGMRAIAILLVCIFHFQLLPVGEAGFIGVDIFFVISGFLITQIILAGLQQQKFSLLNFYYRRIRRLYPALVSVLILYLAVAYFLFLPRLFDELAWETFFSLIYGINIYLWQSVDYFGIQAHNKPLLHMWSLAVEEQFYVIYPLVLIGLYKLSNGRVGRVLFWVGLLVAASFVLGWVSSSWKPQAAFYLLPTRAWELGAGGVLALALLKVNVTPKVALWCGPTAVVLLIFALAIHSPSLAFPGWFAALPVIVSVLFILGGETNEGLVNKILANNVMVFFGKISYPLYLVHWPVKIILANSVLDVQLGWRLFGMVVSVVIAWTIYKYIETPIRTQNFLRSAKSLLWSAGLSQVAIASAVGAVIFTNGAPGRFSPEVHTYLEAASDTPNFQHCDTSRIGLRLDCTLGDKTVDPKIMLIGDSHTLSLANALDIWGRENGQSFALTFSLGCLPTERTGKAPCRNYVDQVFDFAANADDITTVMIISAWHRPYFDSGYEYDGVFLNHDAGRDAFAKLMQQTVETLTDAGKNVVLVHPMYWSQRSVPETLARNAAFGSAWDVTITKSEYDTKFAHLQALFARLSEQNPKVDQLSLVDELCASGTCPVIWEDKLILKDTNHMTGRMGPYFAGVLADKLTPLLTAANGTNESREP